jgi:hypothetical protein
VVEAILSPEIYLDEALLAYGTAFEKKSKKRRSMGYDASGVPANLPGPYSFGPLIHLPRAQLSVCLYSLMGYTVNRPKIIQSQWASWWFSQNVHTRMPGHPDIA